MSDNEESTIVFIDPASIDVSNLDEAQIHLLIAKCYVQLANLSSNGNTQACEGMAVTEQRPDNIMPDGEIIDSSTPPCECEPDVVVPYVETVKAKGFPSSIHDVRFGLHYNPNGRDIVLGRYHKNNISVSIVVEVFSKLGFSEFTKDRAEIIIMLFEKKHGHHVKDDAQKLEKHLKSAAGIYLTFLKNTNCLVHIKGKDKYQFIISPIEMFDIKVDVEATTTMGGLSYYSNNDDNDNTGNSEPPIDSDW